MSGIKRYVGKLLRQHCLVLKKSPILKLNCTKISVDASQLIYPNRKPNSKEYSLIIIVGTEKTNT